MNWNSAIRHLLKWEGGYVNDPDDLGGETKYGITKRRYPHLDIKRLTKQQAIEIYRRDFYEALRIDMLPAHLQYLVFDAAVNQGPSWSIRALQRLAGVTQDGRIGPVTARASQKVSKLAYAEVRRDRYNFIATVRPQNRKFLRGWLNRLDSAVAFVAGELARPERAGHAEMDAEQEDNCEKNCANCPKCNPKP